MMDTDISSEGFLSPPFSLSGIWLICPFSLYVAKSHAELRSGANIDEFDMHNLEFAQYGLKMPISSGVANTVI